MRQKVAKRIRRNLREQKVVGQDGVERRRQFERDVLMQGKSGGAQYSTKSYRGACRAAKKIHVASKRR